MECPRTAVHFHGISGGRITKLHHVRETEDHVRLIQPTRIYMQIGGNDLDSVDISYEYTTSIVKKDISVCRRFLTKYSVQDVVIGQFLPRYEIWYCDVAVYNERVITANRLLKQELSQVDNIHYWKLKGLKHVENLFKDGVHLTDQSQKKFYRSIRGAIIHKSLSLHYLLVIS